MWRLYGRHVKQKSVLELSVWDWVVVVAVIILGIVFNPYPANAENMVSF